MKIKQTTLITWLGITWSWSFSSSRPNSSSWDFPKNLKWLNFYRSFWEMSDIIGHVRDLDDLSGKPFYSPVIMTLQNSSFWHVTSLKIVISVKYFFIKNFFSIWVFQWIIMAFVQDPNSLRSLRVAPMWTRPHQNFKFSSEPKFQNFSRPKISKIAV